MPKSKTSQLLERERFELAAKSGGGILQYEVWGYLDKFQKEWQDLMRRNQEEKP